MGTMNTEYWRTVPRTDRLYLSSTWGQVRSLPQRCSPKDIILKPYQGVDGYLHTAIKVDGVLAPMSFHAIQAMTWIGDVPEGFQIDHIDHDRTNNRIDNLRIIPRELNLLTKRSLILPAASGVKGVYPHNSEKNPWRAQIGDGGKVRYLGSYGTIEEAKEVFDRAHAERVEQLEPLAIYPDFLNLLEEVS